MKIFSFLLVALGGWVLYFNPIWDISIFHQQRLAWFTPPGITTPPDSPVRAMAEWEELRAIAIPYNHSWKDGFLKTLRDIAKEASEEVEVIVICELQRAENDFLDDGINTTNITFRSVGIGNVERIWIRDYGAHSLYKNEVDSLVLVDWAYENDFPIIDDVASAELSEYLEVPLYQTALEPSFLRLDGGNFLTDGLGTAFSSDRVLNENGGKTKQIESILKSFMGVDRYVIFDKLQYDVIHHVDMHMKLLDESTILFGQYPEGVSDWEQLENNINYLLQNVPNPYGEPYEVVRIPMGPDSNGQYPEGETSDYCSAAFQTACYHTYTNALFVNKKVLVPTYQDSIFDPIALNTWEELMPGYEIVGIDCRSIIPYYGAIHCVAKEIGSLDPLWIAHNRVKAVCAEAIDYPINAEIKHRSGIESATVFFKSNWEEDYIEIPMASMGGDHWEAAIPAHEAGSTVYYYIQAKAISGKEIQRPLAAPSAYLKFTVEEHLCRSTSTTEARKLPIFIDRIISNPSMTGIFDVFFTADLEPFQRNLHLYAFDSKGRTINLPIEIDPFLKKQSLQIDLSSQPSGVYHLVFSSGKKVFNQKLIIL